METRLTFGEWLVDRIYTAGLDQSRLAAALGLRPSAVSNWANHTNPPSRKHRADLSRLLGVERDELDQRIAAQWPSKSNVSGRPKEVKTAQRRTKVHLLAGVPASATQWVDVESQHRMIELPEDWLRDVRSPAKAVTVSGDCLIARGIFDGDLVICEPVLDSMSAPQNKVVLVRIGDEYTLKVWSWVGDDTAELRDGNGAVITTLSIGDDFEVLGVARKRWGDVL